MIAARRIGTGLGIAAATLGVFAADRLVGTHWITSLALIAFACGSIHELYRMLEAAGIPCHRAWGTLTLGGSLVLRACGPDLLLTPHEARELSLAVMALGFLGPLMLEVARARREVAADPDIVRRCGATAFGLGYIGVLCGFLLELRMLGAPRMDTGLHMAFLLCLCVKLGDSAAYFVGRTIGRIKLNPVSPRKTVEGSIASVVGSVAAAVGVGSLLGYDWRVMAGFGLVVDLAGQGGDLLESYVKRALGAKDSAATFGEMGGCLDMADALILAAPVAWLWAALLVARGG